MKKHLSALILVGLLSACTSDPTPVKPDFAAPSKIKLDVASITVIDRSGFQPADSPYNTNDFRPTISDSMRQWVTDHLEAAGTAGQATVIIKDARLTAQALPREESMFTRQQATKYNARAEMAVETKVGNGFAMASAQASRFETLPENPTRVERQNAYFMLLNGLMRDLNQNMESSLREHMRNFIIADPVPANSASAPATTSIR